MTADGIVILQAAALSGGRIDPQWLNFILWQNWHVDSYESGFDGYPDGSSEYDTNWFVLEAIA
jgi:hypothetical protein